MMNLFKQKILRINESARLELRMRKKEYVKELKIEDYITRKRNFSHNYVTSFKLILQAVQRDRKSRYLSRKHFFLFNNRFLNSCSATYLKLNVFPKLFFLVYLQF